MSEIHYIKNAIWLEVGLGSWKYYKIPNSKLKLDEKKILFLGLHFKSWGGVATCNGYAKTDDSNKYLFTLVQHTVYLLHILDFALTCQKSMGTFWNVKIILLKID